ncbi:hypothetical protein ACHAXM_000281 [Skeletonema potamos]
MKKQIQRAGIMLIVTCVIMVALSTRSLNDYHSKISFSTKIKFGADEDLISSKKLEVLQANHNGTAIPKLLWMYWGQGLEHLKSLSNNTPANRYAADFSCVKMMIELNPTWNVMVLNEDSAKEYAPIFSSIVNNKTLYPKLGPTTKGDLLRLELLSRYGGVYADTSICPFKGLDSFITAWVGKEKNGFFAPPLYLGAVNRSHLSQVAQGNVPMCHDHSKIKNRGIRGKGAPFRTSSNWFLASTNPHNPLVDEWLTILHKHMLSLPDPKTPYFLAHCALTQARFYNETVDNIWASTFNRYKAIKKQEAVIGRNVTHSEMIACGGMNEELSRCAIVKRPAKQFVLSGNYSNMIQMQFRHDNELQLPSLRGMHNAEDEDIHERRRLGAMNATAGIFSYVHVSKCGGSTWVTLLRQLKLSMFPTRRAGWQEFSVQYQTTMLGTKAAYHLTTLRSPRHHVFSMFMHCKYFQNQKNKNQPNRWQWRDTDDEAGFKIWLDYHVPMGPGNRDKHQCHFHPANYQSRHLTSSAMRPHGLEGGDPFEPDVSVANRTYWELDFVGLTEFVHESRCLLYYRLKTNAISEALTYLDNKCRCNGPAPTPTHEEVENTDNVHVKHHNGTHRLNLKDLPQDILSKVDDLTRIDQAIYNVALHQFIEEIAWLESKAALGRRVLCDDVLRSLQPELSYLPTADGRGTNVTKLYLEAVGRRIP